MSGLILLATLSVATLATSVISGVLGMAGGMILLAALLAVMPVPQAMVLHGITQLASNAWRAGLWHASIDWRCVRNYALGACLAGSAFGYLQLMLSRPVLLIALGASPFVALLLPRRFELNAQRPLQAPAAGAACTGIQLLSGVSGPLLDAFFLRSSMDRRGIVATKATLQTLGHGIKALYFGVLLSDASAHPAPVLVVTMVTSAIVGTSASRSLLDRLSDADFRLWTRRSVMSIGVICVANGVWTALT